ncbi:PIN domain-containing protein [Aurantimonas sp. VKM B-3413]|uniref:type II toxin-antitoxin system VapC family toxin n=1 Tax=Aurantimonas sp. VKM B-3413 TaxID=2779401 RepID=UPI001E60E8BD|nr:PIN domain-containing protein [Aurantimonas sp. VKM B-3413]
MILVDTSAWIEYLNGTGSETARSVRRAIPSRQVVLGDLILVEILQGIRDPKTVAATRETLLLLRRESMCGFGVVEQAAANFRHLRRRGITIRGTVDVILATWCIVNGATIIHNDRDMTVMEGELGLIPHVDG